MKKVFLFLATAALFASCSDDLLEPNSGFQALNEKGITFTVADDATRGMVDPGAGYKAYFFAEKDQIRFLYKNAKKGTASAVDSWSAPSTATDYATYKATRSENDPYFTAASATDLLDFDGDKKAEFFATYLKGGATSRYNNDDGKKYFEITAPDLSTQTYNGYIDMDKRLMYAYAKANRTATDPKGKNKSVGETVKLTFHSPLSTILFRISDIDNGQYNDYSKKAEGAIDDDAQKFGKLQKIEIESQYSPLVPTVSTYVPSEGNDVVSAETTQYLRGDVTPVFWKAGDKDGGKDVAADKVGTFKEYKAKEGATAYSASTGFPSVSNGIFTYDPTKADKAAHGYVNDPKIISRKATLNIGTGGSYVNNDEEMNLYILPVPHDNDQKETYKITYTFENVTLTYDKVSNTAYDSNEGAYWFTLKISETFPCIVTNGDDDGDDRSLYVNKGKISKIFATEGINKGKIIWNGEAISPTAFSHIYINAGADELATERKDGDYNDDWDFLNLFTAATTLEINNDTKTLVDVKSMAALTDLTAANVETVNKDAIRTGIKVLNLPKVTSFKAPSANFTALTDLTLTAYDGFSGADQALPEVFFNGSSTTGTKSTLVNVDLSGVSSLQSELERHNGISFKGFGNQFKSVTLKDGVQINAEQFSGCTGLTTINGKLNITGAVKAFYDCTALKAVQITDTKIPAGAFQNSKVEEIRANDWTKDNKNLVAPTSIGADAFNNNTAIKTMDLSKAETIGARAFKDASLFTGNEKGTATLDVQTVSAEAFAGTAVKVFILNKATKTETMSLNSSELLQIYYVTKEDVNIAVDLPAKSDGSNPDEGQVANGKIGGVALFVTTEDNYNKLSGLGYESVIIKAPQQ